MINRILVPLDPSEYSVLATERAGEIAMSLKASLTGLTIVDVDGILESVALPFHAELMNFPDPKVLKIAKDTASTLEEVRGGFREYCLSKQVPCELRQLKGTPSHGILDLARFYDVVVMGLESHFSFEAADQPGDTVAEVLDLSPVPVLLAPKERTARVQRVLVAYDGSPSATRALHALVELWPVHQPKVRVVVSHDDKVEGGHLLDECQKFLQAHGVEHITTELTEDSIIRAVEERHLEWAELIVAGVRSKLRLKKFFLGSFARFLVGESNRMLLLCQ